MIGKVGDVFSDLQNVEAGMRGYVLASDERFLEPFHPAANSVRPDLAELRRLTRDNASQQERLAQLTVVAEQELAFANETVRVAQEGPPGEANARVKSGDGRRLMEAVRSGVAAMRAEEEQLLRQRQARAESSTWQALLALGVGLAGACAVLAVIFRLLRAEIAQRRFTEEALRRSEQSLAVTLHSIGDGMISTDTKGRILRINRVAQAMTGWCETDAVGRPIGDVFRIVNEETKEAAVIPVDDVLATGEIHGLANHTALIARDGTERAIADSAAPIRDGDGAIRGVVLVFRDVGLERAAEIKVAHAMDELDRFFTLSIDFLCISSADGYFRRVSPAVTDILGWTVAEFLAQPYLSFIHPDDRPETLRQVERQVRFGEKVLQFENRYQHRDGSWRLLSWRSVPQPGGLMYATARDVTELKRTEDRIRLLNTELRDHSARLEEANTELEAFSYSVSHDLRAPLRHIQGYVEMLNREGDGTFSVKGKRYLTTIAQAGDEMGQLIDDLLSFSRMSRTEMRLMSVPLDAVVADGRRGLELAVRGRNITWKVPPLPPVQGDPALLRQVFANLLGNAVKYSRGRDPAVIEVGVAGEEDGRIIFFVKDNGAGFDMQYAHKLFGVFSRLHSTTEFEGTGIGLANVRRIVTRHGGRTWAEGQVDAGATFFFTLQPAQALLSF